MLRVVQAYVEIHPKQHLDMHSKFAGESCSDRDGRQMNVE